ncbi:rasGEF domain-containing protein [Ditylenchus destructor]|uniref:RasGEF domain-containing protein n=1 Tax=Ditylenchus destructor TaxID=166010 RepID=A0AAD4N6T9_9BILA|nr:rasGEF domain-containing protein [Ditylenchus destructor]
MNLRRNSDCIVIQPSDMIVHNQSQNFHGSTSLYAEPSTSSGNLHNTHGQQPISVGPVYNQTNLEANSITYQNSNGHYINGGSSSTFHRPVYGRVPSPAPKVQATNNHPPPTHPRHLGHIQQPWIAPPQPPPKPNFMMTANNRRPFQSGTPPIGNHGRASSVSDSYTITSSSSTVNVPSHLSASPNVTYGNIPAGANSNIRKSFHEHHEQNSENTKPTSNYRPSTQQQQSRNAANITLTSTTQQTPKTKRRSHSKESSTDDKCSTSEMNPVEKSSLNKPSTSSSFAPTNNFQRLSKMRLNFSRKDSDENGATTVKVRSFASYGSGSASARSLRARSTASSSTNGDDIDDFSGLPETAVDSDDEDDEESCPSHDSFQELRDNVRECLEKEPADRNSDDISVLMDFMQQMPALASLPMSIKRQLCLKMVFAIVPHAGTVIMQHKEKVDAWSVVVNGVVEHVKASGERIIYRLGDCFGAQPSTQVQHQDGEMRTVVDDCEFVLVEHSDYCSIMSTLNQHIEREADSVTGEVVREAERRVVGNQVELLIIKAIPDKLVQQLVDDSETTATDAHYLEDFLLMYRVFISEPTVIVNRMLEWFEQQKYRDKVARIILLWVNNHFNDFESDKNMTKLLDSFEGLMERAGMHNQLSLLNITCSVKSKPRTVTLTRSNRDQELAFSVLGGYEFSQGVFISEVESNSLADKNGLKRGDEILEVNGQNFKHIPLSKALDVLRESTHLSLTVKSNLMGFKELMIHHDELSTQRSTGEDTVDSGVPSNHVSSGNGTVGRYQKKSSVPATNSRRSTVNILANNAFVAPNPNEQTIRQNSTTKQGTRNGLLPNSELSSTMSIGSGTGKSSMFEKLFTLLKGSGTSHDGGDYADEAYSNSLRASRSNPDISAHSVHPSSLHPNRHSSFSTGYQCAEQAVKIYRSDQSFRYLTVYPETTAKNVVQLALQEFGMSNNENTSLDWSLCECTVTREKVIKQRRLPDDMHNLAEKIGLNSRFYLKNNHKSENLIPDELAPEVLKESRMNLYTLNAQFIATQLTLQDFSVFASIEPTEYVNQLFRLESRYGWPQLTIFEDLFNTEMWWVVTEICYERNVYRRSKLIKKFIKIARHCRELRNFNSMFAIVSGLEKPAVRRLSHSWERVSGKYMKMLSDIQQLLDPSRNMSKYRQHLAQVALDPPVIPIYPVLRKDLTFAHEANSTYCGKLVNFEKLRMIARIIRSITRLSSVQYDVDWITSQMASGMDISSSATLRLQTTVASHNAYWANARQTKMQNPKSRMIQALGTGIMTSASGGNGPSGQSRKKLYERTLMLRKVKAYLAELPVIDIETELDRLSLECEPPAPGGSVPMSMMGGGSSSAPRRRMPSPSPSSLSSHSNQSADQKQRLMHMPKFGVESPQAVQKMLSLVQNSKVKTPGAAPTTNPPMRVLAPSPQLSQPIPSGRRPPSTALNQPQVRRIPSFNTPSASSADLPPIGQNQKRNSLSSTERSIN